MPVSNKAIVARIGQRLKDLNIAASRASLESGGGADLIRDLRRNQRIIPRLDTIENLAKVLGVTPEWLAFGAEDASIPPMERVPIIGEVAAGLWLDIDGDPASIEFEQFPIPFDPRFPKDAQYGLLVRGTSVDRRAKPGDILHVVDRGIFPIEPSEDDLVIVERRRGQAGQKEVTAKVFFQKGKVVELRPDSEDQKWTPLILNPRHAKGDEEIAIIAVAIAIYKPLKRKR